MSLLKALVRVVEMPVRVAVDVVKLPVNLAEGRNIMPSTTDGLEKIEEDLND